MYDEKYGAEFYELLAELDISENRSINIRYIGQGRREYQAERQKALDAFVEWYQTVGYCDTDETRKNYIIEYYSELSQKEVSFGVSNEEYEKFICALNEAY